MPDMGCLIIDDVQAAASEMTGLGREVTSASVDAIRTSVLSYASKRNWFVLRYQTYVDWARDWIKRDPCRWVVLDPLFPVGALGDRAQTLRQTRLFDGDATIVTRRYARDNSFAKFYIADAPAEIGIIDDASASGRTIKDVTHFVEQRGGLLTRVLVAASSRSARESFRVAHRAARWSDCVPGDWNVIHLRDGCPMLPYSGRATDKPAMFGVDGARIEIRVSSVFVPGNLWQVLYMDAAVRHAVDSSRLDIARRLTVALGRSARIADLSLLGPFVSADVTPGATVASDALL
jgi:hypothetical protein